ncbi:MAG: hypothetical protein E6I91_13435 [Chloroflexi bacterium]|nr:MAG: hypothetical protein E6I91_13435 [Chloroflexota bacterium]
MERNPNQTHLPVSDYSGPASERQPSPGSFPDQKVGSDQDDGYAPYQPAYRDQQPCEPPPRWARALVQLILGSSSPC